MSVRVRQLKWSFRWEPIKTKARRAVNKAVRARAIAVKAAAISPHRISRGNRAKVAAGRETRVVSSPASRNEAVSRAVRARKADRAARVAVTTNRAAARALAVGPADKAR